MTVGVILVQFLRDVICCNLSPGVCLFLWISKEIKQAKGIFLPQISKDLLLPEEDKTRCHVLKMFLFFQNIQIFGVNSSVL